MDWKKESVPLETLLYGGRASRRLSLCCIGSFAERIKQLYLSVLPIWYNMCLGCWCQDAPLHTIIFQAYRLYVWWSFILWYCWGSAVKNGLNGSFYILPVPLSYLYCFIRCYQGHRCLRHLCGTASDGENPGCWYTRKRKEEHKWNDCCRNCTRERTWTKI